MEWLTAQAITFSHEFQLIDHKMKTHQPVEIIMMVMLRNERMQCAFIKKKPVNTNMQMETAGIAQLETHY